jgi:hypothetical protein
MKANTPTCLAIVKFLSLCAAAALFTGGCSVRRRPVISWNTAALTHPVMPARARPGDDTQPPDNTGDPIPELRLVMPPPSQLAPVRNTPARPRVVAPPLNVDSRSSRPETPVIQPQMTLEEATSAQHETNLNLSVAESNLARARGRVLNAVQADLASKIRGFVSDARKAAQAADWTRANSLAKKARVLSEELAGSL